MKIAIKAAMHGNSWELGNIIQIDCDRSDDQKKKNRFKSYCNTWIFTVVIIYIQWNKNEKNVFYNLNLDRLKYYCHWISIATDANDELRLNNNLSRSKVRHFNIIWLLFQIIFL